MTRMYALTHTRIHANDVIWNHVLPNMCLLCRRRKYFKCTGNACLLQND